jgi:hypothetical protein
LKKNAGRLRRALSDSHALAERLDDSGFALDEFEVLQNWQRERLAQQYRYLTSQKRYRAAGEFFLAELYGGLHFRERDQEMERVLPVMVRMLRDDMLLALAEAFELQSLSLDLDMDMAIALQQSPWNSLDPARYGAVYRTCGRIPDRKRQVDLIRRLGLQLNKLVHHRLVLFLIRTLRGPARAAGFGLLQSFLEQGLFAFREMGDGTEFIETIWRKETQVRLRLQEGHEDPFG